MQIFGLFIEHSTLVLTGIFIAFISSIIYRITPTGFISLGKYRTKEGAIIIYLLSAIVLGLFTPLIYQLSDFLIQNLSIISIIGLLLFLANFVINQSVPNWRHTTSKTLIIYFLGIVLIICGLYFKFNFFK